VKVRQGEEQVASSQYKKAMKSVHYAVRKDPGDTEAMTRIGDLYAAGQGIPRRDEEPVKRYANAAPLGHAGAQSLLGYLYEEGLGVPKDVAGSRAWYKKAAEGGDFAAQTLRAWRRLEGICIERLRGGCGVVSEGYGCRRFRCPGTACVDAPGRGRRSEGSLRSRKVVPEGIFHRGILYAYGRREPRDDAETLDAHRRSGSGESGRPGNDRLAARGRPWRSEGPRGDVSVESPRCEPRERRRSLPAEVPGVHARRNDPLRADQDSAKMTGKDAAVCRCRHNE
jgi:hypothetical protein